MQLLAAKGGRKSTALGLELCVEERGSRLPIEVESAVGQELQGRWMLRSPTEGRSRLSSEKRRTELVSGGQGERHVALLHLLRQLRNSRKWLK